MRHGALLFPCALTSRDTFQQPHALLHGVERFNVYQISTGQAVLSDEDRLAIALKFRQQFSGLPFQRGDQFSTHGVILKYHSLSSNAQKKPGTIPGFSI
jgi:hypothetical protein